MATIRGDAMRDPLEWVCFCACDSAAGVGKSLRIGGKSATAAQLLWELIGSAPLGQLHDSMHGGQERVRTDPS